MNRTWIVLAVGLAACSDGSGGAGAQADAAIATGDASVPPLTGACTQHYTLHGLDPQTPRVVVDDLALDESGTTFCLELDATSNMRVGHFGADTTRHDGETSPYELALFDAQGVLLRAGWDLAVGSPPTSFATLEHDVPAGTTLQATLRIRMRAGTGVGSVGFELLEPFE